MRTLASLTADEIAIACDYVKEQGLDVVTPETVLVVPPVCLRSALMQHMPQVEKRVSLSALQKIIELHAVHDYFVNNIGMQFVLVPAGTFWMSENRKNAQRQQLIAEPFFMGAHPVTQRQWQVIMGENPSCFSRNGGGKDAVAQISEIELQDFPVEQVSWDNVQGFLNKLNAQTRESHGWVYRLPNEIEWEYACRGAGSSKEDCSYDYYLDQPTFSLFSTQANIDEPNFHLCRTCSVGSYQPNRLGLYDMHGNVWEWIDSLWELAKWELAKVVRMVRGGSWSAPPEDCTADARYRWLPSTRRDDLGCRLVMAGASQTHRSASTEATQ